MEYPSDGEIYDKIKRVIFSCETQDHFNVAANMICRFRKLVSKRNNAITFTLEELLFMRMRTVLGERVKEK